ncbi:MAG: SpoIIE family protein phosphatase [Candidatus Hydrogenedentes bacterium]|nr:SpoIIE family protein phosphatase [Candidatus Hydrogenedentota bacterium]
MSSSARPEPAETTASLRDQLGRYAREAEAYREEYLRLRAELDLRERAMEASNEGIVIFDVRRAGNPIVYVNAGFERQTGYGREEVLERSARFIHGPQTDPGTLTRIRDAIEERRAYTAEIVSYRKDGSPFWNRISLSPVHSDSGEITHFVAIQSDVSDRTRSNADVQTALELLEKTNQQLTRMNRRMKRNLETAARVQHSLLPERLPRVKGVDFAWKFKPCDELAGDILNIFQINRKTVGLYLLDVSGHGTAAALLAVSVSRILSPKALSSSLVREEDPESPDYTVVPPARVADELNVHFPWDPETGQFFTFIYGVLDTETLAFRYVSAGHPGPIHFPRDGEPSVRRSGGLPIGLASEPYEEQVIQLAPGDRLHLYSDGLTEVMNRDRKLFGLPRLIGELQCGAGCPLAACQDRLMEALEAFRGGSRFDDDLSLVSLEVRARS